MRCWMDFRTNYHIQEHSSLAQISAFRNYLFCRHIHKWIRSCFFPSLSFNPICWLMCFGFIFYLNVLRASICWLFRLIVLRFNCKTTRRVREFQDSYVIQCDHWQQQKNCAAAPLGPIRLRRVLRYMKCAEYFCATHSSVTIYVSISINNIMIPYISYIWMFELL